MNEKNVYYKFLKEYVFCQRRIFAAVCIILTLQSVASLVIPFTYQQLLDKAFPEKNQRLFIIMLLVMLGCYFFNSTSNVFKDYFLAKIAENLTRTLRIHINNKISVLQYHYFDEHNLSEIISKYNKELETIKDNCGYMLIKVISNILSFISASMIIAVIDWKILIISLILLSLYFLNGRYWGKKVEALSEKAMQCNEESMNVLTENYRNVLITKLYSAYKFVNQKFKEKCDAQYRTQVNLELVYSVNINSGSAIIYILSALIWFVEGLAVFWGKQTIGTITALINYQSMLISPLAFLAEFNNSYKGTVVAIKRIMTILCYREEEAKGAELQEQIESIQYADVDFRYKTSNEAVIEGVKLSFEKGTISGIIGGSGCGKSSLIKMLPRLYPVKQGKIFINDTDLNKISLHNLRRKMVIVSQESYFYSGTIRENLNFGNSIDEIELIKYSKMLGLYEEIMKMPDKWDTVLNEGASNLSGGQKKRLDILRALIMNPDIIIFDESTASIDLERRRMLFDIIEQIKNEKIVIMVTHNIEECERCDNIFAVKNKKVFKVNPNDIVQAF